MPTKMQKYLFKASAIALRGRIHKPYFQDLGEHLPAMTYAGSSARHEFRSGGFKVGQEVQYDAARTEIIAGEQSGVFNTSVTAQVFGLQVGTRLFVEEVTCRLQSTYDSKNYPGSCYPRISPAGSIIKNLKIDGKVQQLVFPPAFGAGEAGNPPVLDNRSDAPQPGFYPEPIYVPNFGTIYYAEWSWVHPDERHQQHLTMLRLSLGSDLGAAMCVGIGGSDGAGWPPGN